MPTPWHRLALVATTLALAGAAWRRPPDTSPVQRPSAGPTAKLIIHRPFLVAIGAEAR